LPASENHIARIAVLSTTTKVGHGPIWRPALRIQVLPMRSIHEPPERNGA